MRLDLKMENGKQRTEASEESSAVDAHKHTYHLHPLTQSPNKSLVLGSAAEAFCLDLKDRGESVNVGRCDAFRGLAECFSMRQGGFYRSLVSVGDSACWCTVADGSSGGSAETGARCD